MVRRIYANGRQYNTIQELKAAITEAYESIEINILIKLINSMGNRVFDLIRNNRGPINY